MRACTGIDPKDAIPKGVYPLLILFYYKDDKPKTFWKSVRTEIFIEKSQVSKKRQRREILNLCTKKTHTK